MDSASDREVLRQAIERHSGMLLPEGRMAATFSRLARQAAPRGFADLAAYCRWVARGGGLAEELDTLVEAAAIHHTGFFREAAHFAALVDTLVPRIEAHRRVDPQAPFKLWSAAASIGAEAYSAAMVLEERRRRSPAFAYTILATDISHAALATARAAVYPEASLADVPPELLHRHFLCSKDRTRPTCRAAPHLRQAVRVEAMNLMDPHYPVDCDMDAIFCRNVFIYFSDEVRRQVFARLGGHLRPGGWLFLGHAEGLGLATRDLPLRRVGPSCYERL